MADIFCFINSLIVVGGAVIAIVYYRNKLYDLADKVVASIKDIM